MENTEVWRKYDWMVKLNNILEKEKNNFIHYSFKIKEINVFYSVVIYVKWTENKILK